MATKKKSRSSASSRRRSSASTSYANRHGGMRYVRNRMGRGRRSKR